MSNAVCNDCRALSLVPCPRPAPGYCAACGWAMALDGSGALVSRPAAASALVLAASIVAQRDTAERAILSSLDVPAPLRAALLASGPVDEALAVLAVDRYEGAMRCPRATVREVVAARVATLARSERAAGVRVVRG